MSRTLRRPANQPVPALTRARVCAEALALVDEEGLEALSMRRLGARLGIEAMSLYHHVRDKADLLDALHAAVLGSLEPEGARADEADWRALLGGLARALRSTLLAHPHVAPLFFTRSVSAPEAVATLERVQAAMAAAGFAEGEITNGVYVVGMFTIGHVGFETANAPGEERDRRREATFRFGLDALLDGIERAHGDSKRRRK